MAVIFKHPNDHDMTVKDVIGILENMPQNMPVVIGIWSHQIYSVERKTHRINGVEYESVVISDENPDE